MRQKVFRTGDRLAITLPKEMVDALALAEGNDVSVELDAMSNRILIAPSIGEAEGVDTEFVKQVADFIEQYRPALKALAG